MGHDEGITCTTPTKKFSFVLPTLKKLTLEVDITNMNKSHSNSEVSLCLAFLFLNSNFFDSLL